MARGTLLTFCIVVLCSELIQTALSELEDSYLNVDFMMRDKTKKAGKNVRLRCELSGSPKPYYTWFKDDIEIGQDNDRFIQTLKSWGSRLTIKNAKPVDSGYYTCKATNKAGQKSDTAYLHINGPMESVDSSHPKTIGSSTDNTGFCQPHRAITCSKFMSNEMIYVKSGYEQSLKEEKMISQLTVLASSSSVSKDCLDHMVHFLCYYTFPLCAADSTNPTPLKMCRDECDALVEDICKDEFTNLLQHPLFGNVQPNCNDLPYTSTDSDKCKSINIPVNKNP